MRCERCGKTAAATIISVFNANKICLDCAEAEERHSQYKEAVEAIKTAEKEGKKKFDGIGWPPPNGAADDSKAGSD